MAKFNTFINPVAKSFTHIYPRSYIAKNNKVEYKVIQNVGYTEHQIAIIGIPLCVSPRASIAKVYENVDCNIKRLHIYSNIRMDESQLNLVDAHYKSTYLPLPNEIRITPAITESNGYPTTENFYIYSELMSIFLEYRYLNRRYTTAKIVYDPKNGARYNMVLPKNMSMIIYIMPQNFMGFGAKHGVFQFDNNIIIRVYSKKPLCCNMFGSDDGLITKFDKGLFSTKLKDNLEMFFGRMLLNDIQYRDTQVIAHDSEIVAVIGQTNNIHIPSY